MLKHVPSWSRVLGMILVMCVCIPIQRWPSSARAVNALAYTVGRNVVFDEGRFAPQSSEGQKLIAHEIVHVMQQSTAAETSPIAIGPERDQYESQADNIAQRLAGGSDAKLSEHIESVKEIASTPARTGSDPSYKPAATHR